MSPQSARLSRHPGSLSDVTIQDVARAAGVSAASVSNLLNGRIDRMRPVTRARIEAVISELDYRPNPIARQLKTGRAPMIGLIVPTVANPLYGELAVAVERAALKHGYHVLLCNTLRDRAREREFAEQLSALGVRGLISSSGTVEQTRISEFVARGISIVALDLRLSDLPLDGIDVVTVDNEASTRLAVEHLVSLGHRSIAYATGPVTTPSRADRLRGYRNGLAAAGLSDEVLLGFQNVDERPFRALDPGEVGRLAARQLAGMKNRPTAVVTLNDTIAIGLMSGLSECNLSVPDDVSVVGIDDIHFASLVRPGLTTIRQSVTALADVALERLIGRLGEPNKISSEHVTTPELVVRASTAAPRQ